ncbi:TPA: sugar transferase [Enterococcus faecium]
MKDIYEWDSSNEKFEIYEHIHLNTSNFLLGGMKRFIDIVMSILGLILLFVPFIFVALLIKIDDPKGPIFFCQTRIGLLGKPFILYKFRTMFVGAENQLSELIEENEIQGAMFKMKHDPRVTRIGSVLRKLSIDEFPQLLNVLKGDMSIVGPRPALPQEVEQYSGYHRLRLLAKPGCTGLWQVSGRNNLHFEEMIELDLNYINTGNFLLDVKIMIKTILVIITQDGAY